MGMVYIIPMHVYIYLAWSDPIPHRGKESGIWP